MILSGKPVADRITELMSEEITLLSSKAVTPCLAVVRIGAREDDLSYERGIKKRFALAHADVNVYELPEDCSQKDVEQQIVSLSNDSKIHGILLFRPLPKHLDEKKIINLCDPSKDVDCMTDTANSSIYSGTGCLYPPCTAQACIEILDFYGIALEGKRTLVVGRSLVVGKPLTMLLLGRNATPTISHTRTRSLGEECIRADIIFAAAGSACMIKPEYIKKEHILVDVGINFLDGNMVGDISPDAYELADSYTPVPGGVGAVTTSVLLKHTVLSAKNR